MNKNTVLDKGYVIATILNVFFLLGLIFISHLENLYILILYVFFIPIGVVAYFLFFYKDDAFDEMEEKYDYHEDNKK
ncbi:TPA: hypothetical protein O4401_002736 [Staphylococcus aureus]|nr:hypothetical protein [Staphylococcus aureus]